MSLGLPMGLALASGVNTYLPLFALALFARFANVVEVSPRFQWLISDQAILILAILTVCEILAEKFPGFDNVWDFVHTLLRPVAGALAAGAALSTNQVFEMLVVMLTGASLATAAHSAKSGLRLASTSKSLGFANPILSIVDDVAVVGATLLSLYAPWVMLAIVVLFVAALALVGPLLFRVLRFNLSALAEWLKWLAGKGRDAKNPHELRETLLEFPPGRLKKLNAIFEPGEELLGVLGAWKRSGWGPRRAWLLITPRRLVLAEKRMLRRPKIHAADYSQLALLVDRESLLLARWEYVTRQNRSVRLLIPKSQAVFARLAAERVRKIAGLSAPLPTRVPAKLAAAVS